MKGSSVTGSAAERYDNALTMARHYRLATGCMIPQKTATWPSENIAVLEKFKEWLLGSGSSHFVVAQLYLPMAGHALGLNLKSHPQLDIAVDLEKALDYVKAKNLSAEWTEMCRCALEKFRLFLRQERGVSEVVFRPPSLDHYTANLPPWLAEQLARYQRVRQRNWRQTRLTTKTLNFWNSYSRFWRWLCERYSIATLADVKRQHVLDFVDHQLTAGLSTKTVNGDIRYLRAFLLFLQEQDHEVPAALLRLPSLKEADSLPRFLTDEQVRKLRDDMEEQVIVARYPFQRRDALLARAAFYLLWQGGMRLGEVEELCLEDLDLAVRKLMVRLGKGLKDRTVYLTENTVTALEGYLAVRGIGPDSHVFLYHNLPVHKDLIRCRIRASGERVGVSVAPHRLRHTCATQLLNAGCRVTSIQKFLGHQRLNSTMIYARVHDQTVANDYYAAMEQVEKSLALAPETVPFDSAIGQSERAQLLALVDRLAQPELCIEARLSFAEQIRSLLSQTPPIAIAESVRLVDLVT